MQTRMTMQRQRGEQAREGERAGDVATRLPPGASRRALAAPSGGAAMDAAARAFLEPRLGHDFGHVRVHADDRATAGAAALDAAAFTVGPDIFFDAGHYRPGSPAGLRLLAHELTHVVQQERFGAPAPGGRALSERGDAAEREAEAAAERVAGGGAVAVQAAPSAAVARGVLDWVEDKASGAWDDVTAAATAAGGVASDVGSAVGSAASDVGSAIGGAASAVYQGYEHATDFKAGTNLLDQGVDWVEKQVASGNQKMADSAQGIPVLGPLAQAAAFVGTEATDLTGGLVKGAGDVASGIGNAFFHPIDTAAGMEGILEHNSPIPFMGSTLKAAHGLYDLAVNGGGQYGNSMGDLANHIFNPLQQAQDDMSYDSGLARGILTPGAKSWDESWQRIKDNPMDTLGRAAANIAPMVMGAGEAGVGEDAAQAARLPEPGIPAPDVPPTLRSPYAPPGVPEPAPFNPDITGPSVEPPTPPPAQVPNPVGPAPDVPPGPTTYQPTGSRADWAWDPQQYPGEPPPSTPPGFEGLPRPYPAPRVRSPVFPDQLPDFGTIDQPAPSFPERPMNTVLEEPPSSDVPAPDTVPGGPTFPQPPGTPIAPQPIPKLPGGPKEGPPIPREEPVSSPPDTARQPMDVPGVPAPEPEEPMPSTQPAPPSTGGSETPTLPGLGGLPAIPRGFDPGALIQLMLDTPGAGSVVQLMQELGMPIRRA